MTSAFCIARNDSDSLLPTSGKCRVTEIRSVVASADFWVTGTCLLAVILGRLSAA